jgi:Predicted esterase of the alpha-beta hydrolase superfamily
VHERLWTAYGPSSWSTSMTLPTPSRALVLGGGGATGIGWLGGLIYGLRDLGIDLRNATTVFGTSAGSVTGTHLRLDTPVDIAYARLNGREPLKLGRLGVGDAERFVRGAFSGQRNHGRAIIGRAALKARTSTEDEFVSVVAKDLEGLDWPAERLVITTVDAVTGELTLFTNDSGVPRRSCRRGQLRGPRGSSPGGRRIQGRHYVDGGVRSAANVDLAIGHDAVLVLAPIPLAFRRYDRPGTQARRLGDGRALVIAPDRRARALIGFNPLDMSKAPIAITAGREQAERVAAKVADLWA